MIHITAATWSAVPRRTHSVTAYVCSECEMHLTTADACAVHMPRVWNNNAKHEGEMRTVLHHCWVNGLFSDLILEFTSRSIQSRITWSRVRSGLRCTNISFGMIWQRKNWKTIQFNTW